MAHRNGRKELMEMFLDKTAGETYRKNRLATRESDSGVELIGYGWLKLAEYNETLEAVTVFTGHQSIRSSTVSRWLNEIVNVADRRERAVILSGESPTVAPPNEGTKYIGNYISMDSNHSPVERDVKQEVEESIVSPV